MAFYPRDSVQAGELEVFAKKTLVGAAFAILAALMWAARDVLILVFIAAVLAAGISPAVHRVRVVGRYRLRRNISRGTAVVIVYFPFLLLVILLAVLMVPRLIGETRALSAQLPELIEHNILTPMQRYLPVGSLREYLRSCITVPRAHLFGYVRGAATAIGSF